MLMIIPVIIMKGGSNRMKEKLEEQIKVLEKAQQEAIYSQRYEVVAGLSQQIFSCMECLECYK